MNTYTKSRAVTREKTLSSLDRRLQGTIISDGDPEYEDARRVWNGMIDRYPAVIVRCMNEADVIAAVSFARENNLPLSVRGGGHNVAGYATNDGGLVIDLSLMRSVVVDPQARTARVQGGALIADLDAATQQYGLAVPMGVVSETGVAGLTLNGGMGWLRRKYGLSCDHLLSADVVTADGRLLCASETENSDLLWGLRGGGGNFGVVTSFEFRLVEVGPRVMFLGTMYPLERAPDLLPKWRDYMKTAPEEFTSQALFWTIPAVDGFPAETHNRAVFIIVGLYSGHWQEGERLLQPLRELAEPVLDLSGPAPYTEVQTFYDPLFPRVKRQYYWKSLSLDRLNNEVMSSVIAYARNRPTPDTLMVIWHQGGAMSRVPASATAFGDRSAPYLLSLDTTWEDPAESEANIAWTRAAWKDMHRFSSGSLYLNFPGLGEDNDSLVMAAYGANYNRLVELKTKYDPTNLFNLNQNIKPFDNNENLR